MPSNTAVIVLNRNLPKPTDILCEHLQRFDGVGSSDLFVVEAGSDDDRLSRFSTWHVTSTEAREKGLRVCRGFNYALRRLWAAGSFDRYEFFLLVTNDSRFDDRATLTPLVEELARHPRVGMLSPCGRDWGELGLLEQTPTRYFWYVHNTVHLLRKQFVVDLMNADSEELFLFDGTNFRGFGADTELIAKGYANDWATAITRVAFVEENERFLREQSASIRTESYEENLALYVEEGLRWMKRKYGFTSRWQLQMYAQNWYERFFQHHPEYRPFSLV
jgi:hypothetical protein